MQKRNYQKELTHLIDEEQKAGRVPRLFLHSCCAPCSSYVLEYLSQYFSITDFYYNPNITDREEYGRRISEIKRLIQSQPHLHQVTFVEGTYEPEKFFETVKGLEDCREGGERCFRCFRLRLEETARMASGGGTTVCPADGSSAHTSQSASYDYFTTTLTISPLKNAAKLNEIGEELAEKYGIRWLPCDFKKLGGYQRSIELSREYQLYRQDYCGCVYSKRRDLQLSR